MANQFCAVLGAILFIIGIFGNVSGGHDHNLAVFGINATHNAVHLVSGALALTIAFAMPTLAPLFCLFFGGMYGIVAVAGFVGAQRIISMLNLNMADNFLHVTIAATCLWIGVRSMAATPFRHHRVAEHPR